MVKERIDGENKKEKFNRIATDRTRKVLQKIKILGNCANRGTYEYTDEDVKKIFNAIDEELKIIKEKFRKPSEKAFRL